MPLAVGARLGPYEILSPLGSGGMGEVYRARDTKLRREVALKILPEVFALDADRIARFKREAQVLASLNHPNIGAIYGLDEANGTQFLVLELVDGESLDKRITRGPIPVEDALGIAKQIAEALEAAHEKGIIHRDLKPANIALTRDGNVKVLDFGLAKGAERSRDDLTSSPTMSVHDTRAGVIVGTAAYMSPEQARGLQVDKRTDVWSFGCVLYEMLVGRRAFTGQSVSDVIAAILRSDPGWDALPPTTPPAVRRLLHRLLDRDFKRRLRDIGDARFDLDDAPIDSIEPPGRSQSSRPRRGVALSLLGTIGGLIATLGILLLRQPRAAMSEAIGRATVSQMTNYDGTETGGALSPDGRSFAFISDHGGSPDIWVRQVAGGEPVRLTDDAAVESDLAYGADGETIYFTKTAGAVKSIWRIGALGGPARKVLNDAQIPSPSPDGHRLAWFAGQPEADFSFALAIAGEDGSNKRVLVEKVSAIVTMSRAAWSPDGQRLAYSSGGLFAPRNLFVVNLTDGRTRQVTHLTRSVEGIQTQAWLTDGRHLIVSYISADHFFVNDLAVVDIDTGELTRLTMNISDSFSAPSLSADSTRMVVSASRTERDLWRVPFGPDPDTNGRAAVRLLDASQDPMWTYVTRDGRTLLFNNALVGSRNLWTMPLGGGAIKPRQITTVPGEAVMHSSLSPDGTYVAFASSATGNADIWVQNVDGSDLRQLTNDPDADSWPVWSPDGHWIIFSSLQGGRWATRQVLAGGGAAEKVMDGFFRGDWIRRSDGPGTLLVTSTYSGAGLQLIDFEHRQIIWQDRRPGNAMPMFSPDGRSISIAVRESRDRDTIWVYDVATGKGHVAVRFPQPFQIIFRTSWVDNGKAFVVNRGRSISHIVLLDRFGVSGSTSRR